MYEAWRLCWDGSGITKNSFACMGLPFLNCSTTPTTLLNPRTIPNLLSHPPKSYNTLYPQPHTPQDPNLQLA